MHQDFMKMKEWHSIIIRNLSSIKYFSFKNYHNVFYNNFRQSKTRHFKIQFSHVEKTCSMQCLPFLLPSENTKLHIKCSKTVFDVTCCF